MRKSVCSPHGAPSVLGETVTPSTACAHCTRCTAGGPWCRGTTQYDDRRSDPHLGATPLRQRCRGGGRKEAALASAHPAVGTPRARAGSGQPRDRSGKGSGCPRRLSSGYFSPPTHTTAREGLLCPPDEGWLERCGGHVLLGWSRPPPRDALDGRRCASPARSSTSRLASSDKELLVRVVTPAGCRFVFWSRTSACFSSQGSLVEESWLSVESSQDQWLRRDHCGSL